MGRTVCWFSCGAASAIAAWLTLQENPDAIVARCVVSNEHSDNQRFADQCEKFLFKKPIINLSSSKYMDCWQVWEERRFLNGPNGALCTTEMKKLVRRQYEQPDDIQIFGFTNEEGARADRFRKNNPEIISIFPLIDLGYSKNDCFLKLKAFQIELPEMYRLGYRNANCVGCVKGGAGYWNKIREDFPLVFRRMSKLEENIGASCIKGKPLSSLPKGTGRYEDLELPDCGLFCGENL